MTDPHSDFIERIPLVAGASDDYVRARAELVAAELDLTDQIERVAELRKALPPGPRLVRDYVFLDARDGRSVGLDELLPNDGRPLVVFHLMYGPRWDEACPSCTMWNDGFNDVAHRLDGAMAFVVIGKARPEKLGAWAKRRRWNNLRLLSSIHTSFNADLGVESSDDEQYPGISVFVRDSDGWARLYYSGRAAPGPNHWRGIDHLTPDWHLLDLLPRGRGDYEPTNKGPVPG
jgi:predicted dithiol-disulfide oxidoreductase (DUF899 family)